MTKHISTIELYKERMKFNAAHFTIFSATHRERLHGHNYYVHAEITTEIQDNGLTFDYREYKGIIYELCDQLNSYTILPLHSKYLTIEEEGNYIIATFNNERMPFLKTDVKLLPIRNTTVEELSKWFVEQLSQDTSRIEKNFIQKITVKVFSGPGQSGSYTWMK